MHQQPIAMEIFQHIRIVLGIVLGLSMARLLNGIARIVQHPTRYRTYSAHLVWVATLMLTLIHFWWWEFALSGIQRWTFPIYLFLVIYVTLLFFLCVLLFPDDINEYGSYEDFFISRRKWFYSIFAITILFDLIDTLIKGQAHYATFAGEYPFRVPAYVFLCAIAIYTPNRWFHLIFAAAGFVYELSWISRLFNTLQ